MLVRTIAHSLRSRTDEVLEALLRSAMDEARRSGATSVAVPTEEIPARMRLLPGATILDATCRCVRVADCQILDSEES